MEDALRLARRAGGIEDEQRLLCIHGCRFALSIHLRRLFMIPMIASSLHRYITAGGLDYNHRFHDRRQLSRSVGIALQRHFLAVPPPLASGASKVRNSVLSGNSVSVLVVPVGRSTNK